MYLVLDRIISKESFDAPDRDRLSVPAPDAMELALLLLLANPSADRREIIILLDVLGSFFYLSFSYESDESRDVDTDWASRNTLRVFAVDTSLRFCDNMALVKAKSHLIEIFDSLSW